MVFPHFLSTTSSQVFIFFPFKVLIFLALNVLILLRIVIGQNLISKHLMLSFSFSLIHLMLVISQFNAFLLFIIKLLLSLSELLVSLSEL